MITNRCLLPSEMDRKFIPCAKMFLLTSGRDPIEGLFFTKDLKIQFGPRADLAAAHKWWCLSDWHHSVATVAIDIFQINGFSVRNKIGTIAKIFVKIEDPEN